MFARGQAHERTADRFSGPVNTAHLLADLTRIVASSPAHQVVQSCLERLDRALGGTHLLWLADYQHTWLTVIDRPGSEAARVPVDDSAQGRSFASQTTIRLAEERAVMVPVTARGDRLGVLERRAGDAAPDLEDVLQSVACLLCLSLTSRGIGTDNYERQRRTRTMTLAAELQWSLLRARAYRDERVSIAGSLEPAYSIAGDAFEWSRFDDQLAVSVIDGTGRGVPAALTTMLALTALRNARTASLSLADQAALADQALFAHYDGAAFASALLVQLNVETGAAVVIDAGSPLMLRVRGNDIEQIEPEAQLPLGMFEETVFLKQDLHLTPGDRLVIVSDGIHASIAQDGVVFGERRLKQVLADSRLLSPAELTRHTVRELRRSLGLHPEDRVTDDAAVVCLDWHGPR